MNKLHLMKEIESYENAYIDLSRWNAGSELKKETVKLVGDIETPEERNVALITIENFIRKLKIEREGRDSNKLFLKEIIDIEKPQFAKNNLIISPTGSGKTTFSRSLINEGDHVLFLVSTTSLKRSLVPDNSEKRKLLGNRMYTSKNKMLYGEEKHKIYVSTYHEFGERIKYVDDFARQFDLVICDEIHSLPLYQEYDDSPSLLVAMRYLFRRHESQPKYFFTATDEHINTLKTKSKEIMRDVEVFDYSKHEEIMRHIPLSSYKITSIEQTRLHLRARRESFNYFGHKIFAFCKTIRSQRRLKEICESEGYSTQMYWSINNTKDKMTEEQIVEMNYIIDTGMIPDKYDVIIVNSAMQEGWNLVDERVKLAIINTINQTEHIQALGRIRRDLDVLVYRTKGDPEVYLSIPSKYLDKPLTVKDRDILCEELGVYDNQNRLYKWRTISKMLSDQGFLITKSVINVKGVRSRVETIHSR